LTTIATGKKLTKLGGGRISSANLSMQAGSTLAINAGTVSTSSITGDGAVEIHSGSLLSLESATAASKISALKFDGVTDAWQGKLDLKNSSLVVQATSTTLQGAFDTIVNQIRMGRAPGGQGITSSAATRDTAIGAILNNNGSGGVLYSSFFGQSVDANSILIRYTFNGDLDLDGIIDADDYAKMDAGFVQKLNGWANGDLDYNGKINADDYFLMDRAFSNQSSLPAPAALAFGPTNVPEPDLAAATAIFGALILRRRGSRRGASSSSARCSVGTTRRISSMLV
jgi:hypothetical protein